MTTDELLREADRAEMAATWFQVALVPTICLCWAHLSNQMGPDLDCRDNPSCGLEPGNIMGLAAVILLLSGSYLCMLRAVGKFREATALFRKERDSAKDVCETAHAAMNVAKGVCEAAHTETATLAVCLLDAQDHGLDVELALLDAQDRGLDTALRLAAVRSNGSAISGADGQHCSEDLAGWHGRLKDAYKHVNPKSSTEALEACSTLRHVYISGIRNTLTRDYALAHTYGTYQAVLDDTPDLRFLRLPVRSDAAQDNDTDDEN